MDDVNIKIWTETLERLKNELNEQTFNAWISPLKPSSFDGKKLVIECPNQFFKNWIEERYLSLLEAYVSQFTNEKINIELMVKEEIQEKKSPLHKEKRGWFHSVFGRTQTEPYSYMTGLNRKYTFENFVVGPGNRFAHAASLAVAESPAKAYNPLFIYGGVGLGKTHLMHAIGNEIAKRMPKAKILYISSEDFTNQLISAIQTRATLKFREKYRNVDMILIDDIHFIAGKESTQEEFFHTFNTLYDAHKQIVISSDRSPKEISGLEERLVSRFGWGLITDIQPPDFETRIAILRKKSEKETVHLPDELFYFLAENIKTNIRELEGALIRVVAYAKLMNIDVTVNLAKDILKGMIIERKNKIDVEMIQIKVAEYFNIKVQDLKVKKRTKTLVYPRQIAMYLCRDLTELSLPEIGSYFGGRDHTTVLHACEKIGKDIKKGGNVKKVIDDILVNLKD